MNEFAFLATWICLFLLMIVRVFVVWSVRTTQLDRIYNKAIMLKREGKEWRHLYEEFYKQPTWRQDFDLTKWTHRQFYGDF